MPSSSRFVEHKIRLTPEANERWQRALIDNGCSLSAILEAIADIDKEFQDEETGETHLMKSSTVSVGDYWREVGVRARHIDRDRRSRKPRDPRS